MTIHSPSWHVRFMITAVATLLAGSVIPSTGQQASRLRVLSDTTAVQEIELGDGTKLLGRIVRVEGNDVFFRTLGNVDIQFERRDVRTVREPRGDIYGGEFWPADPSNSRLFLAPTARVAGHGHGYFGVYELVVPSFGVGIGNVFMVSGGFSAVPGIDLQDQVFYIAPKAQVFNSEYVQGAVGLFWAKPGTSEESVGMAYSGVTAGTPRAAFSGAIAFPFGSRDGFSDNPLLMLGGEVRATKRLKIISENWIAPSEEDAIVSLGFRIIASRLTVEVAVATSTGGGGFLPVVNFSTAW